MGTVYNTNVVSDGLVYYADAGNRRSYPGAGEVWSNSQVVTVSTG